VIYLYMTRAAAWVRGRGRRVATAAAPARSEGAE